MKSKAVTKIVGGKYKGRILDLPSLDATRSSKSILKESFFNVLQFDIIDTLFIEAFGGSGGIGLEALSRGAKHSYFCEIDKNSYRILQNNCEAIEPENCTTIYGDSFDKIPSLLEQLKSTNDEVILYLDPPFDFRDGMDDIYEKTFNIVRDITNKNVILVTFEHMTGLEMPESLGKFSQFKTKKFGKSSLTYYHV
ncbi:MAG: 16S rRNA (guanine(966)-N(2))-methyltransferase RsmD [Campylobacterota bacterium]|nr:16S rRNA (guanine(966)-N(2))-methyltransferase RsmD [Campylobacterota bacterium]